MFNFYFGDIIGGDSDSFQWELLKALLATIPAVLGVLLGVWYQKKIDRDKIREIQNLQLFNFNEHIKKIIENSEPLTGIFTEFAEKVKQNSLDDVLIKRRVYMPDLSRVLEIDKEKIFLAFVQNYKKGKKKQAAEDYRKAYNSLDSLSHSSTFLYDKYDTIIAEIFQLKLQVKKGLMDVRGNASRLGRTIKLANPEHYNVDVLYNAVNGVLLTYFDNMGDDDKPLTFHEKELFIALRDALLPFLDDDRVYDLLSIIRSNLNLMSDIRVDMEALGELLESNSKYINVSRENLAKVSTAIDPIIKEVIK